MLDKIFALIMTVVTTLGSLLGTSAYGGLDVIVPAGNRKSILNAFDKSGAEYDFVFYSLNGHGLKVNLITPAAREYTAKLFEYCKRYF